MMEAITGVAGGVWLSGWDGGCGEGFSADWSTRESTVQRGSSGSSSHRWCAGCVYGGEGAVPGARR